MTNEERKEKRRIASIIKTLNKVLERNLKKAESSTEINAYKYVLNIINKENNLV